MVKGVQEDKVGHRFRFKFGQPFTHLVGLEPDGAVCIATTKEPQSRFVQRMPAVLEGAFEVVQFSVLNDGEFDGSVHVTFKELNPEGARIDFGDDVVTVLQEHCGHGKAAGASLEEEFAAVVERAKEAGEWKVPFHWVDAGYTGEIEEEGRGEKTVAGAGDDAGGAGLLHYVAQELDEGPAGRISISPVEFLGETLLEVFLGDRGQAVGLGVLQGAVDFC